MVKQIQHVGNSMFCFDPKIIIFKHLWIRGQFVGWKTMCWSLTTRKPNFPRKSILYNGPSKYGFTCQHLSQKVSGSNASIPVGYGDVSLYANNQKLPAVWRSQGQMYLHLASAGTREWPGEPSTQAKVDSPVLKMSKDRTCPPWHVQIATDIPLDGAVWQTRII